MAKEIFETGGVYSVTDSDAVNPDKPKVTLLTGGGWAVQYTDYSGEADGNDIYVQRFDVDGSALNDPFVVNATTVGGQIFSEITWMPDGGWVSVWRDDDYQNSVFSIRGQAFDGAGDPRGEEFIAYSTQEFGLSVPTVSRWQGGFVVGWAQGRTGDYQETDVFFKGFEGSGEELRPGFTMLNSRSEKFQGGLDLAPVSGGGWAAVYDHDGFDRDFDADDTDVLFRVMDDEGRLRTELTMPKTPGVFVGQSSAVAIGGGDVVYVWTEATRIEDVVQQALVYAIINASGQAVTFPAYATGFGKGFFAPPQVAALPDGGFAMAYRFTGTSEDDTTTVMRIGAFNDDGSVRHPFFDVPGFQSYALNAYADFDFTVTSAGNLVVAWHNKERDVGDSDIYVQVLSEDGTPPLFASCEDRYEGTSASNTFDGGACDDLIEGRGGDDMLLGGAGRDTVEGGSGNDTLKGGDGDDTLDGGSGRDRMEGGAGDDSYIVDDGRDVVVEAAGDGIDTVFSSVAVVVGPAEVERVILTGSGDVRVIGNGAANEITGNAGRNILIGGGGGDTITGGGGGDYFVLREGDAPGVTSFTDFDALDVLALDDRFFGLGDGRVDVRGVDPGVAARALERGTVEYDRQTGELTIRGDLVADLGAGTRLGVDDVLLF